MADQIVLIASITISLSGLSNPANLFKSIQRLDQKSLINFININKTNLYLILDLA